MGLPMQANKRNKLTTSLMLAERGLPDVWLNLAAEADDEFVMFLRSEVPIIGNQINVSKASGNHNVVDPFGISLFAQTLTNQEIDVVLTKSHAVFHCLLLWALLQPLQSSISILNSFACHAISGR